MKGFKELKKKMAIFSGIILVLINFYMILSLSQQAPLHVVISEVYPDAINETGSEWIELYNPNNYPVNISGWEIYTSSASPDVIFPEGSIIPPHGFFLVADVDWDSKKDNKSWPNADYKDNIRLDNEAGWVKLLNSEGKVVDTVGWGDAEVYETLPAIKPDEGKSIERKDLVRDCPYVYVYAYAWAPSLDTDNNLFDFIVREKPTPMNSGNREDPSPVYISIGEPRVVINETIMITTTTPVYLSISEALVGNWTLHWRLWHDDSYIYWENVTINASSEDFFILFLEDGAYYLEFYVNNSICNRYPEVGWHNQTIYVDSMSPFVTKEIGSPSYKIDEIIFISSSTPIWINATDIGLCKLLNLTVGVYNGTWKYYYEETNKTAKIGPIYLQTGIYYITYEAVDALGNKVYDNETFYVDTWKFEFIRGWNQISFPIVPPYNLYYFMLQLPNGSQIWIWNVTNQSYEIPSLLSYPQLGLAYWIWVPYNVTVTINGTVVTDLKPYELHEGWNMVGPGLGEATISQWACTWRTEEKRYSPWTHKLKAGKGYWIWVQPSS